MQEATKLKAQIDEVRAKAQTSIAQLKERAQGKDLEIGQLRENLRGLETQVRAELMVSDCLYKSPIGSNQPGATGMRVQVLGDGFEAIGERSGDDEAGSPAGETCSKRPVKRIDLEIAGGSS